MPEQDFELYLSLLGRFLRLNPAQRDDIADELRDHLEQRLEELAARGLSREEAIRQALDEFGNAAELASHFTKAAHIRRRRLIMRCTFGTVAALAASLLVATAFWPQNDHLPQAALPRVGVAHEAQPAGELVKVDLSVAPADDLRAQVAVKLETHIDLQGVSGAPLGEAIAKIGEQAGVDLLFDQQSLADEGVSLDQQSRILTVKHTKLTARAVLDLIMAPIQLGYTVRDGLVLVTTQQKLSEILEIRVYNVRDLVSAERDEAAMADGAGGAEGGFFSVGPAMTAIAAAQIAQGMGPAAPRNVNRTSLAKVITTTVDGDTWSECGGPGEITQYNGLLIINQTAAVHTKVERLLGMIRGALREKADRKR